MKVLLLPYETPVWARPAGAPSDWSGAKYPPANAQDYADFISTLVGRYAPQGVLDYELWNEPNMSNFFAPQPNVAKYVELLQAAYPAAHAANSQVNIIAGSTAPAADAPDGSTIAPATFLAALYAQGGGNYFDAVSHHPYTFPFPPSNDASWSAWQQMSKTYGDQKSLRQVMVENGDAAKKIWITEYGMPTSGDTNVSVSEQQQADMLAEAVDLHASYDWVGPMFVFSFRDTQAYGATNDIEAYFGVYRSDNTPKLAVASLTQAFARYPAPATGGGDDGGSTPVQPGGPGTTLGQPAPGQPSPLAPNTGAERQTVSLTAVVLTSSALILLLIVTLWVAHRRRAQ